MLKFILIIEMVVLFPSTKQELKNNTNISW